MYLPTGLIVFKLHFDEEIVALSNKITLAKGLSFKKINKKIGVVYAICTRTFKNSKSIFNPFMRGSRNFHERGSNENGNF